LEVYFVARPFSARADYPAVSFVIETGNFISAGFLTSRPQTSSRLLPRSMNSIEWLSVGRVAAYSSGAVTDFHRLPYYPSLRGRRNWLS